MFRAALSPSPALESIPSQIATFDVDVYNQGTAQGMWCWCVEAFACSECVYVCVGVCMCGNGWLAKGTGSHVINFSYVHTYIHTYIHTCDGHAPLTMRLCVLF